MARSPRQTRSLERDPQTLTEAVHLAATGKSNSLRIAARLLDGCPPGGSGETDCAWRQMIDCLPQRRLRAYTADQWVERVYYIGTDSRYHCVFDRK
jgi:hypothetical protein